MKLITEQVEDVKVIKESKDGKQSLYIQGRFMVADEVNRNKRLYEMRVLRNAVKSYQENFIEQKRSLGELNHGPTPSLDLSKASHIITKLWENGNIFMGKAKILESLPMGKIAAALINEGVKLGVSSRAVGSLIPTNEGYSKVGDDLILSCIDLVSDPSGPNCFVEGLMEGVNWLYDTKKKIWISENIKNKIEDDVISRRLTEERKLQHFENYLKLI
ncbi:MAG: primosomal protein [Proteobacteria bacterium]|nr:primosomal protein [Pseudomonadota bacterium]